MTLLPTSSRRNGARGGCLVLGRWGGCSGVDFLLCARLFLAGPRRAGNGQVPAAGFSGQSWTPRSDGLQIVMFRMYFKGWNRAPSYAPVTYTHLTLPTKAKL